MCQGFLFFCWAEYSIFSSSITTVVKAQDASFHWAHLFKSSMFFWHAEQECKLNVNHTCIEIQNKSWRQTHEGIQKYFIFCPLTLCQYILKSTGNNPSEILNPKAIKSFSLAKLCMMF